ncbi:MAG TPA: TonB-dependent receptor [Nevskiaceae bacterium]|nr:TonB-dependent receptor [Nevskiaceae bacterium]
MASTAWAQEPVTTEELPVVPVEPEQEAQAAPPADEAAPVQLEEIVVTATKRAEPVREIPASISVLTGESLEQEGVQQIDQIVAKVPGVNLTDDGLGQPKRVTIRGIAADVNANFTAGTLFGDIPFSDSFVPKVQLDPNPFDMATVEVLKGPQGTLFGGSGLNGMIRYVPEAPDLEEFQLKYFTQLTSYPGNGDSGWSYGAAANAPFADNTAAVRVMGFHRTTPGFVDDTQSGKDDVNETSQYGFRGILAWQPNEDWKVSLMGAHQRTEQDDVGFTDNRDGDLTRGNTPRPSPTESEYSLANLAIERSFDWATLMSQTSWFDKKFDAFLDASRIALGGVVPILTAVDDNHSKGWAQEFRAVSASDDSRWKWLAGAFYFDMDLYDCAEIGAGEGYPDLPPVPLLEELGLLATPCSGNASKLEGQLDIAQLLANVTLKETAVFGELTRELGDDWDATLGARVYQTKSGGTVANNGLLYTTAQNQTGSGVRDATVKEEGISPKASIVFHPTRDFRAYLTASRGFRFGGPQLGASTPTTEVPEVYKSDKLWNYELGVRTDWFDQALRVDGAAYYIDWKDAQVSQQSSDTLVVYIDNVGGVEAKGAELQVRVMPPFLSGLSLDTSVAWNKTETTKAFRSATREDIASGSPWPLAPRWQTSTTLAYALPVSSWMLGASVRHTYADEACNTIECTAKVFGYNTWDLNLSFGPLDDESFWPEIGLSLNNFTDERGFSNVSNNPTLGDSVNYIAPRMLVLRIGGRF